MSHFQAAETEERLHYQLPQRTMRDTDKGGETVWDTEQEAGTRDPSHLWPFPTTTGSRTRPGLLQSCSRCRVLQLRQQSGSKRLVLWPRAVYCSPTAAAQIRYVEFIHIWCRRSEKLLSCNQKRAVPACSAARLQFSLSLRSFTTCSMQSVQVEGKGVRKKGSREIEVLRYPRKEERQN